MNGQNKGEFILSRLITSLASPLTISIYIKSQWVNCSQIETAQPMMEAFERKRFHN